MNRRRERELKKEAQNTHIDYMRLRASSEKSHFIFFTLGHSTANLHFYKNIYKKNYLLYVTHKNIIKIKRVKQTSK